LSLLAFTIVPGVSLAADQRLSDLVLQMQRLQQEMQQLRGQLEVQQHQIDTLKRQQQEQYLDLEARLGAKGRETQSAAAASEPVVGRPPPAESAAPSASGGPASDLDVAVPARTQIPSEKDAYLAAFGLLKERRYDEAIRAFEDVLAVYPNGQYADNARYWLGETYYVKRDYEKALAELQNVVTNYPLSPKLAGAMLKVGYIQDDLGDRQSARKTLEEVVKKFPGSTEARLAQSRLDKMSKD
jgi:tol-pal system protein YbgF